MSSQWILTGVDSSMSGLVLDSIEEMIRGIKRNDDFTLSGKIISETGWEVEL
jgi:hypothetical protein